MAEPREDRFRYHPQWVLGCNWLPSGDRIRGEKPLPGESSQSERRITGTPVRISRYPKVFTLRLLAEDAEKLRCGECSRALTRRDDAALRVCGDLSPTRRWGRGGAWTFPHSFLLLQRPTLPPPMISWFARRRHASITCSAAWHAILANREPEGFRLWYEDVLGVFYRIDEDTMRLEVLFTGQSRRH